MQNELLITASLAVSYCSLLLFYRLAGKAGIYSWIAVSTIIANIEVTILVYAFGIEQTLGNTLFASSFLATDILSERYGKRHADKGVLIGILTSGIFIVFTVLWRLYEPSPQDIAMPAVRAVFGNTPRILAASQIAYIVSEFLDVKLYHAIWKITENKSGDRKKFLWLRNNAATMAAQLINIIIFNTGAFAGIYDSRTLLSITTSCYVIYVFTSLMDTPFLYLARRMRHRDDSTTEEKD